MWQGLESRLLTQLAQTRLCRRIGRLSSIQGMVLHATGLDARLGELVDIQPAQGGEVVVAEVVGLRSDYTLLMPYAPVEGLCLASEVHSRGAPYTVPVGDGLLGRVLDATCEPLDDLPAPEGVKRMPRFVAPINPLHRSPITTTLVTGVKAVDVFTPLGRGQRIGIFAGSGVGKSTLLGMMSKYAEADVIVIALIGERGARWGTSFAKASGPRVSRKPWSLPQPLSNRPCYGVRRPTPQRPSPSGSEPRASTCC
ncbi:hypothetical protein QZH46_10590 [Pseudomonas corrugata]